MQSTKLPHFRTIGIDIETIMLTNTYVLEFEWLNIIMLFPRVNNSVNNGK